MANHLLTMKEFTNGAISLMKDAVRADTGKEITQSQASALVLVMMVSPDFLPKEFVGKALEALH